VPGTWDGRVWALRRQEIAQPECRGGRDQCKPDEEKGEEMGDYDVLILKYGGRWNFWLSHAATVERYMKAHAAELTKVQFAHQAPVVATEMRTTVAPVIWDPTRGGMRMPHLHYAGEVFMLNEGQWAEFSKSAVSALAEKMAKAKTVTFESVMQISEAMGGM
jgi:hypothetical protein